MRSVYLHGSLKKEFGEVFKFDVQTAAEALRALNCAFPNTFVEALKNGSYYVIRGRRRGGMHLDIDEVNSFRLGSADLHIVPVVKGAAGGKGKGGGVIKAVLGVALIGAAIFFSGGLASGALLGGMSQAAFSIGGAAITWGNIGMLGLALTLSGVSSMMAAKQKTASDEKDTSFTFNGPVNVNEQGLAIPLIYGEIIVGSQPISAGFDIEDLGANVSKNAIYNDLATANMTIAGGASAEPGPIADGPTA